MTALFLGELQGPGVHTVPLIDGVAEALPFEDVAQMTAAVLACDLRPPHPHAGLQAQDSTLNPMQRDLRLCVGGLRLCVNGTLGGGKWGDQSCRALSRHEMYSHRKQVLKKNSN